jgi:hypothetical protein
MKIGKIEYYPSRHAYHPENAARCFFPVSEHEQDFFIEQAELRAIVIKNRLSLGLGLHIPGDYRHTRSTPNKK